MQRTRVTAVVVALAGAVALTGAFASSGASAPVRASGAFAWLHPASPPAGWNLARTPGGAALAYPSGWTPIKTDPGTASVALLASDGRIEAYLNATPRMGAETLNNWRQFRPQHNRAEGQRDVRLLAAIRDASFRSGRGACVIDSYTTSKTNYREIACLVSGARSSAVVVAAAPSALFDRQAATLQRAVSTFAA
jgi:hypothetical protein